MLFGRLDSTRRRLIRTIQIGNYLAVLTRVYQALMQLTSVDLPLTEDQFVQMSRTLLLKRVQDVIERESSTRPAHFVRLA